MSEENKKAREDALRARLEYFKGCGQVFGYPENQERGLSKERRDFIAGFEEAMRTLGLKP